MPKVFSIEPSAYLLWALLILTVPLDWLLGAAVAAAVHEASHLAMICLLGGHIDAIRITPGGAQIQTGYLDLSQELLCAMAGPVGSFSLVLFCKYLPQTAICAVVQGCFNLIPMHPLDGGRALHCCVCLLFPNRAYKIEKQLNVAVMILFSLVFLWAGWYFDMEAVAGLAVVCAGLRLLLRKKPCIAA